MLIKRVLTNNAVITVGDDGKDKIVCGKGIAFKKRSGDEIDTSLINQVFILQNDPNVMKFEQLLKDVPIEYIRLAYDIAEMAKLEFAKNFNDSMIITLSDHLYTAIQRCKEGMLIKNALLWDIKNFYEIEYEIGLRAVELIKEKINIDFPEDEAGFIALHIVNAQLDKSSMENIFKVTKLIQEITTIVKYHFHIEFDTGSAYYYRFITHLKFFSLRLFNNDQYDENDEDELLNMVIEKYTTAYDCANKIKDFLIRKYNYHLKNDELLYLTIHVHRIVTKMNAKGGGGK